MRLQLNTFLLTDAQSITCSQLLDTANLINLVKLKKISVPTWLRSFVIEVVVVKDLHCGMKQISTTYQRQKFNIFHLARISRRLSMTQVLGWFSNPYPSCHFHINVLLLAPIACP